jgi:multidrug efflux pump subunit AcrA (membrane-fusion protein)
MTRARKISIAALAVVLISGGVAYGIYARNRGVIGVQASHVLRQDLTQTVSANGEIKPKKYVNISANTMGRIVQLPVKEGDQVREGDLLIRLDSIQPDAEVRSAEASLEAARAELEGMAASVKSSEAAINSAKAEITRSEADLNRAKQNFDRADRMSKDGLISREQYERSKADFDIANAQLGARPPGAGGSAGGSGSETARRCRASNNAATVRADAGPRPVFENDDSLAPGGYHHVPSSERRRNCDCRSSESTRNGSDDDRGHVGNYSRGESR